MQKEYIIQNPNGIHARPARKIVTTANSFPCAIYLEKDGKRSSAKSLVAVLSLGAKHGDAVLVVAEGEKEEEAVKEIGAIVESVWDETPAGG
jgi:phosphocarrier protein